MSNEMAHYASDCWDAELETLTVGLNVSVVLIDLLMICLFILPELVKKLGQTNFLAEPQIVENFEIEIAKRSLDPNLEKMLVPSKNG